MTPEQQKALDALERLHNEVLSAKDGYLLPDDYETIRAALTAKQEPEKPYIVDGDVALRQTKDVNEELLEALRSMLSAFENEGLTADYHAYVYQAEQAIARAEQKGK